MTQMRPTATNVRWPLCLCVLVTTVSCNYYYFASATVAVDSSHRTASPSSASWSRFSPHSTFVNGHVSTVWFMICRWPQSQEGDWARPHELQQNSWTDSDTICGMDLGGPRKPCSLPSQTVRNLTAYHIMAVWYYHLFERRWFHNKRIKMLVLAALALATMAGGIM